MRMRLIAVLAMSVGLGEIAVAHHSAAQFDLSIRDNEVDFRLHKWIEGLYRRPDPAPYDGSYGLGKSRTVIVHEIHRGDWTWCTVWSPGASDQVSSTIRARSISAAPTPPSMTMN